MKKKLLYYKKNIFIIITALLISIGIILFMEIFLTNGSLLKIPKGYILARENDDNTNVSYTLLEEKYHKTEDYRIYLIGGSSLRAAIVGEEYIDNSLQENLDKNNDVVMLQINMLGLLDALTIVDNLPSENGMVVLGSSFVKIMNYTGNKGFLVKSKITEDYKNNSKYLKDLGYKYPKSLRLVSGNFIKIFLDRILSAERLKDIFTEYEYIQIDNSKDPNFDRNFDKIAADYNKYITDANEKHYILYEELLLEIANICESKGLDLVLIDTPFNVQMYQQDYIFSETSGLTKYINLNYKFSKENDVAYLDFTTGFDIGKEHFKDAIHLNTFESRKSYTDALVYELANLLRNYR